MQPSPSIRPPMEESQLERLEFLLSALGLNGRDFFDLVDWILCERLVTEMVRECGSDREFFLQPDALLNFKKKLESRTGRRWSPGSYTALFERVKDDSTRHVRRRIEIEDMLLLRLQEPLECAKCGARPPEVTLEIDHIVPASRGGSSKRENLQFLCREHNRQKSNSREVDRWLNLP